jgi:hypothetical protein
VGVLGEPDAELAARLEELFEAAEGCRKIIVAARAAVAAGGMLLMFIVFGLLRREPIALVAGLTAVLGGVVLLGSNESTLNEILASIRAHEARRAQLINALGLQMVDQHAG